MFNQIRHNVKKAVVLLFLSTFSIGLIAGCSNSNKPVKTHVRKKKIAKKNVPTGNNIWMKNLAFVPKIKVIKIGTTVTWTNKDVAMHTVHTGTPEKPLPMIASGTLGKGKTFSYTFTKKGTFKYFCTTHPTIMQATVVVQ